MAIGSSACSRISPANKTREFYCPDIHDYAAAPHPTLRSNTSSGTLSDVARQQGIIALVNSSAGRLYLQPVGAENLIGPCEQDEWIDVMECVNSILAMSADVRGPRTRRSL